MELIQRPLLVEEVFSPDEDDEESTPHLMPFEPCREDVENSPITSLKMVLDPHEDFTQSSYPLLMPLCDDSSCIFLS